MDFGDLEVVEVVLLKRLGTYKSSKSLYGWIELSNLRFIKENIDDEDQTVFKVDFIIFSFLYRLNAISGFGDDDDIVV